MANAAQGYAKALFQSIDSNEAKTEVLLALRTIAEAFKNDKSLMTAFKGSSLSSEDQKNIFKSVTEKFSQKEILANFFNLLVDKGRVSLIDEVVGFYEEANDDLNNVARGVVRSAAVLSSTEREGIEKQLTDKMGKRVILSYIQDETVVGGVRAQVGPYTFDDTIDMHIKNIKENLNRSWN